MIWIHSESVPVIEAMLCVYQKYKRERKLKNILIHHDFDENLDEIRKLIVVQKLKFLYETVFSLISTLYHYITIQLGDTVNEILSEENIHITCDAVILQDEIFLGTGKAKTKQTYSREIRESFGLQISQKMMKCIDVGAKEKVKIFKGILESSSGTVKAMTTYFSSSFDKGTPSKNFDINAEDYRKDMACIFYDFFAERKKVISSELTYQLQETCGRTTYMLQGLLNCIKHLIDTFALSDQEKCKYSYETYVTLIWREIKLF